MRPAVAGAGATLEARDPSRGGPDPLNEALQIVRATGTVLLADTYAKPWSVLVPDSAGLAALVDARDADRVAAFHYVEAGTLELTEGDRTTVVSAGELVISFAGTAHRLGSGRGRPPVPLRHLVAERRPGPGPGRTLATVAATQPRPPHPPRDQTTVICGVFALRDLDRTPLRLLLPPRLHLTPHAHDDAVAGVLRQLAREVRSPTVGGPYVVDRLVELLLAEVLRYLVASDDLGPDGLACIRDSVVWAAVHTIHENPAFAWTVPHLARQLSISAPRLTARFREVLGQSPKSYIAQCRMATAAQLLRSTDLSVEQVALAVGYSNQPAFSRAFRHHHGGPPRAWSRQPSRP